jgi:hypothetical protein
VPTKKLKVPPLVSIVWADASDAADTWAHESDIEEWANELALVRSCGYLITKTKYYYVIAADWSPTGDRLHGRVTKIPIPWVQEFRKMR